MKNTIGYTDPEWSFYQAVVNQIEKDDLAWYQAREVLKDSPEVLEKEIPTQKWSLTSRYGFGLGMFKYTLGFLP